MKARYGARRSRKETPWLLLWGGLAGLMLTAPNSAASLTSAGGSRADIVIWPRKEIKTMIRNEK